MAEWILNTISGTNVVGNGQGLLRLLSFSAAMGNEKCDVRILLCCAWAGSSLSLQRLKRDHWSKVVNDYFQPQASWKLLLSKDPERRETMLFGMPIHFVYATCF